MTLKPGDLGVHVFTGHQPMKKPCKDCPFEKAKKGDGYLHPQRMEDIQFGVTLGQPFYCHKSVYTKKVEMVVDAEGNIVPPDYHREYQQCAGAIEYALELAEELGIEPVINGVPYQK